MSQKHFKDNYCDKSFKSQCGYFHIKCNTTCTASQVSGRVLNYFLKKNKYFDDNETIQVCRTIEKALIQNRIREKVEDKDKKEKRKREEQAEMTPETAVVLPKRKSRRLNPSLGNRPS